MGEILQKRLDAFSDWDYKLLSPTSLPEERLRTCERIVPIENAGEIIMTRVISEKKSDNSQWFREENWLVGSEIRSK